MSALLTVFVCGGISTAAGADPIKPTYSNFLPANHIQSKLADAWCNEVGKRTNGKVMVEYHPGQTLTKAQMVYDGAVHRRTIRGRHTAGQHG